MEPIETSRRTLLAGAVALGVAGPLNAMATTAASSPSKFINLLRTPDLVRAFGPNGEIPLAKQADGSWEGSDCRVHASLGAGSLEISLHSTGEINHIQVRWLGDMTSIQRYLGDHWERSYADLEWMPENPNRPMPWYFLAHDGKRTDGYGVRTGPNAFCLWTADAAGISLWADVRSGGVPVRLAGRTLKVCDVVCREGKAGESAFTAAQAFCRQMCPNPRLADHPMYGTNDWDYAYGNNSADLIERVSRTVSELSSDTANRPYSVIDDGWSQGGLGHGPWLANEKFGDMGVMAQKLKGMGVRPGIWFRPLTTLKTQPESWRLDRDKQYLDPTIPESLQVITENVARIKNWGYEMLKHDYTSWDIMGRWGSTMGATLTKDGWHFNDRSRTTAEIVLSLYRTIRQAAGDMRIIGCNTFSHLSAGIFELYRSGDDTSGESWERTRRMGVNTLAFRAAQHGAFYSVDPDIVAITKKIPWHLTEQWLRLVSQSGTALFVSIEPEALGPAESPALKKALALAAKRQPTGEPLDWMRTACPSHWKLNGKKATFSWFPETGASPYLD